LAREAIVRVLMGRADASAPLDEGVSVAQREGLPFKNLVDAALAAGAVERAFRMYLDDCRSNHSSPERHDALSRALLREGRTGEILELVTASPQGAPGIERVIRLVAENAVATGSLTLCRSLARLLSPSDQTNLWQLVIKLGVPKRLDVAMAVAEGSLRSALVWALLVTDRGPTVDAAEADTLLAELADSLLAEWVPAELPWPVGKLSLQVMGSLLVVRGRVAEFLTALRADPEAGALLAGSYLPTYHSQLHLWRKALVGEPVWRAVSPGMTDAAHRLGNGDALAQLFAIATELAKAERDPFKAVTWWRDLGAAYHRVGRPDASAAAFDEARQRALALRGTRHGLSARTTALDALARSELVAQQPDRALATARKLSKGAPRDKLAEDIGVDAAERGDLSRAHVALSMINHPGLAAVAVAAAVRAVLVREGVELGLGAQR
jgi:hypothetical protein